ncbi:helix-turn-helix transcriptional regulator [Streptosporangium lutulentum]|uniref:AraC-like DNA-binding protein n=1 Tax=Streptosporangium lutulentum TaxID=1461250 RepID=A0ABT9QLE3_9ACTN|nr:helix-turn-helix transcriptional regulator [Streptosporangium lutulentum]MDP9847206.1 AraC-like DNA-binding protein [Streptosporangium lutulentum]
MRPQYGGTRGIINPATAITGFHLDRRPPSDDLTPFVAHYWHVEWNLREPYEQCVLPHPSVHMTFAPDGSSSVKGVIRERFHQMLAGRGRVLGVLFHPGGFRPFLNAPLSTVTDRTLDLADVFGPAGPRLAENVLNAPDGAGMIALVDEFLRAVRPERDAVAEEVTGMVALAAGDSGVVRVDDLAERLGVSARRLQRLFAEHVGVGPKWVIRRYRMHEAAERAGSGLTVDWTALAVELGYSDQAHFIRDFTNTVGMPPSQYARTVRDSGAESERRASAGGEGDSPGRRTAGGD